MLSLRRRRRSGPRTLSPAICLTDRGCALVVSVHLRFDDDAATALERLVTAEMRGGRDPHQIELDVRAARSCTARSLELIARLLERGVRLHTQHVPQQDGARSGVPTRHRALNRAAH